MAIELINRPQPRKPDQITLPTLQRYYRVGYEAVRRHTSDAYVICSNRLGLANVQVDHQDQELLEFARDFDVHYYSLYAPMFKRTTSVQENVNFIYNQRASDLGKVTSPDGNGPVSFVGKEPCRS